MANLPLAVDADLIRRARVRAIQEGTSLGAKVREFLQQHVEGASKRTAADREAAGAVSGFVGDVMAAATTVQVNDATEPMLRRLAVLVERRRYTAVRDRVLEEGVQAFSQGAADIGLGLVLLVSAGAIASGAFDLGTLALFTAYLGWLSFLPRMVGRVLVRLD